MKDMSVSIILPTYNEAGNIVDLVRNLEAVIPDPKEIIVVDDNSPDGTANLIEEYVHSTRIKNVRVEVRKTDHGLTKSIAYGIGMARGDIICWLDADFSHPPEVLSTLIKTVRNGQADCAIASRFADGGKTKNVRGSRDSFINVALSTILNTAVRLLLWWDFHDYTSGFIAIRKTALSTIRLTGDYGEYFIDLVYRLRKNRISIREIGFVSPPRRSGQSKTSPTLAMLFSRGTKYLKTAWRLSRRIRST